MKAFNVLDRSLDIRKSYILEASAGTGKTFSIENIVVRLLIENDPLQLEQILVVTFTRAAVRDLKTRIRGNIDKALDYLENHKIEMPDYLLKICEEGEKSIVAPIMRFKQALLAYDQAQIFTIHSFCARMLSEHVFEGDLRVGTLQKEEALPDDVYVNVVKDFIRTQIRQDIFSEAKLRLVLSKHSYSSEKLESALLKLV